MALHRPSPPRRLTRLATALAAGFCAQALAAPQSPGVVAGSAAIAQSGATTTIHNTPGTIINWGSFSIGASESVIFNQQSASSSVLNRVLGNDPTQILGSLTSNGQVFLISPSGLFVGANARIDTAGFVGSTLNLSDQDFLAGRLNFTPPAGAAAVALVNEGHIEARSGGRIYLVAPSIENHGVLTAPNGDILLAAGRSVELVDTGTPGVRVNLNADGGDVVNVGQIIAESGRIGLAGVLIRNSGQISAGSAVHEGGRIFLRATGRIEQSPGGRIEADGTRGGDVSLLAGDTTLVDGSVSARGSSGEGGRIDLLGDKVGLTGAALVDASGASGGGSIRIGGDFQGKNPDITNARFTYVGPDTQVRADALADGSGGRIIVWADETTRAYGDISARGGESGGNGGFAEVSGKRYLDYRARVDTRAPRGQTGTLLLDPMDLTIDVSAYGGPINLTGPTFDNPTDPTTSNNISWQDNGTGGIEDQLATSNVTISTSGSATSVGDITVNAGTYNWTSGHSLTLLAHDDIFLNGDFTNSGGATLKLVAGWDGNLGTPGIAAAPPSGTISGTGAVQVHTVVAKAFGNIALTTASNNIQKIGAESSTGTIAVTTTGDIGLDLLKTKQTAGGSVTVTSGGKILDENGSGTANVVANTATLASTGGAGSSASLAVSADIDAPGSIAATATASAGFGGIRIWNVGSGEPSGGVTLTDNATTKNAIEYQGKGAITLGSSLSITGGTGWRVETPGAITVASSSSASSFQLKAGTTLTVNGSASLSTVGGGGIDLSAGSQVLVSSGGTVSGQGKVNLSAPQVTLQGTVSSSANALSIAGTQITATGAALSGQTGIALDATGTLDLNGSTTVHSSAGDIKLDGDAAVNVVQSSATSSTSNILVSTGGDIRINNGSTLSAAKDVKMQLDGASSAVYLNELTGQSAAKVISNTGGTTFASLINFAARSSGGVILDGAESTTTVTGASGFFIGSATAPATLGSGLTITYSGGQTNAVTATIAGAIASATGATAGPISTGTATNSDNDNQSNEAGNGPASTQAEGIGDGAPGQCN